MNDGSPIAKDAESAILIRMATSRTALLAANNAAASAPESHGIRRSAATVVASLADAPHVTLLMALCVGGIILGPRRTIGIVSRSSVTAWIAANVKRMVSGSV